ncbi:MAG: hypothetical protein AB7U24_02920 [Sulfurimonadaceae bacterium]
MSEKVKIDLPRDLVIPTKLALSDEIEAEYKFLYAYIAHRVGTRGYMWHENKTLAEHLNKSIAAVERGLKALSQAKWIYIDNWVKKGSLYHASFRRVIWVYSDYLMALDKGGYGVARPLPYRTWKDRFVNALLDQAKIPYVLYFFPVLKQMGEMRVSFDPETNYLYRYFKSETNGWDLKRLTKQEADKAYEDLYSFYCAQHKKPNKQLKQEEQRETYEDFHSFQNYIRDRFVDRKFIEREGVFYTVNGIGMLMKINENEQAISLSSDDAIELWQYMFSNQEKIILEEK